MGYLEIENLFKKYSNGYLAVKGMNLSIEQGEFVVFLGPSGCGKTTLIRMIAGLEDVTEGSISLNGKSLINLLPKDRGVSMIFQSYAVWPHMTVRHNIEYPLKLKKVPKKDFNKIVQQVAEITDITKYLDNYPHQLSGGQRQRVAVARAIAVNPDLFLMDEPLSNLDAKLRVQMRTKLKEIHRDIGSTTIFVTHDQSEAMSLADKVVVMKMGEIEQVGTAQQIYEDCETLFVANFIGAPPTNFITVTAREKGNKIYVENEFLSIEIRGDEQLTLKENYLGKEIILGIRPENILIEEGRGEVETSIDFVEPQGAYSIIVVNVNNHQLKVISKESFSLHVGQKVKLEFLTDKILLFDRESERRIR